MIGYKELQLFYRKDILVNDWFNFLNEIVLFYAKICLKEMTASRDLNHWFLYIVLKWTPVNVSGRKHSPV